MKLKHIVIAVDSFKGSISSMEAGKTATNDCGLGMLTALGWCFRKADGSPAGICGRDLADVAVIDGSGAAPG